MVKLVNTARKYRVSITISVIGILLSSLVLNGILSTSAENPFEDNILLIRPVSATPEGGGGEDQGGDEEGGDGDGGGDTDGDTDFQPDFDTDETETDEETETELTPELTPELETPEPEGLVEICDNGQDDDNDGQTDEADSDCSERPQLDSASPTPNPLPTLTPTPTPTPLQGALTTGPILTPVPAQGDSPFGLPSPVACTPNEPAENQCFDVDGNGQIDVRCAGSGCTSDIDNDGIPDIFDSSSVPAPLPSPVACTPNEPAENQCFDVDGNGQIDVRCAGSGCTSDIDNDGIPDIFDVSSTSPPPTPVDSDNDRVADSNDNCPSSPNTDQKNSDGDILGDVCDPNQLDYDKDGIVDSNDNCISVPNPDQINSDSDRQGDACDTNAAGLPDADNDGIADSDDNCFQPNSDQKDTDGDGIGDVCDLTP
jgi:hypothetical protein